MRNGAWRRDYICTFFLIAYMHTFFIWKMVPAGETRPRASWCAVLQKLTAPPAQASLENMRVCVCVCVCVCVWTHTHESFLCIICILSLCIYIIIIIFYYYFSSRICYTKSQKRVLFVFIQSHNRVLFFFYEVTIESTFENVYGHPCFCFAPPDLPVPVAAVYFLF